MPCCRLMSLQRHSQHLSMNDGTNCFQVSGDSTDTCSETYDCFRCCRGPRQGYGPLAH